MANIQQIKLDENSFVVDFRVLQKLLPDYIEVVVTAEDAPIIGRKYDPTIKKFQNHWLEGYEPDPELLSEIEEAIHTTNANVEYLVCLSELGL
jgi:hypothetical protein